MMLGCRDAIYRVNPTALESDGGIPASQNGAALQIKAFAGGPGGRFSLKRAPLAAGGMVITHKSHK
jgi:hypothetical protein